MQKERIALRIISDEQGFRPLCNQWNDLLRSSTSNNVFLTWEFLFTWWKVYGGTSKLYIILAFDGADLVGIAPFYLTESRMFGLFRRNQIEYLGSRDTCFEGLDFIVKPGYELIVIERFIEHLCHESSLQWDLFNLESVRSTSKNFPICQQVLAKMHIINYVHATRNCYVVNLPDDIQQYFSSLSKNSREKLRNKRNRLNKQYDVKLEIYDARSLTKDVFDQFIALHQKRQKAKGNEGSFRRTRAKYNIFHDSLFDVAAFMGYICIAFLRIGDKVVAGLYAYPYNNTLYAYAVGQDPEWDQHSPGTVLYLLVFEHLINNTNIRTFDFLRGESAYKSHWTKNTVESYDFVIWRNKFDYLKMKTEKRVRHLIGQLIPSGFNRKIYERFIERS